MALEVWEQEGIEEEFEITVTNGKAKELLFWPYKMFQLDVLNKEDSQDSVKVMVNSQSFPQASTLEPGRGRVYEAKSPKYWRLALYVQAGESATVRITASR